MNFYLKANRQSLYTYLNLRHWINAISGIKNSVIYLLCDNDSVISYMKENYPDHFAKVRVMSSEREDPLLKGIVKQILSDRWAGTGYAHLTTFLHATREGCEAFWNIDADDTYIAVSPEKVRDILWEAEKTARKERIRAFSLDMHTSRFNGSWTFGITYTDNTVNWFMDMEYSIDDYHDFIDLNHDIQNIDTYFNYLRKISSNRMESFYVENLRFIHCSEYMILPPYYGINYWENGRAIYPILTEALNAPLLGDVEIHKDVIRLNVPVSREESINWLQEYSMINGYIDETYKEVNAVYSKFAVKPDDIKKIPVYDNCEDVKELSEKYGIDKKTVILVPYSRIAQPLSAYFWEATAERLKRLGFRVLTFAGERMVPVKGTEALRSGKKAFPLVCEKALAVISLRNKECEELIETGSLIFVIHTLAALDRQWTEKYKGEGEKYVSFLCDSEDLVEETICGIVNYFKEALY